MKILHITSKPIFPLVDGGCVAMKNLLDGLLVENASVKHLAISTKKHPFSLENYPDAILEKIAPKSIQINTDVCIVDAIKHLFKKGSYNVARFYSDSVKNLIVKELTTTNYEVVILESLYCTPYIAAIRAVFEGKIIVRIHNIESDIWSNYASNETNPFKRLYLKKLTNDLKSYEFDILNKVDGILAITEENKIKLGQNGIKTKCITIPVAVDINEQVQQDYSANNLFHIGAMNWQPNIESAKRLIKLFPEIRKQSKETKLHLVGSNFSSEFKQNEKEKMYIEGFVENLQHFAPNTGILVAPIISGSGVRIKILEMMAIGIPIITTKLGAEGILHENHNCLIIANSDEEIIRESLRLINDQELRKEIGQNAIAYIKKYHNFKVISQQLIEFIQTK